MFARESDRGFGVRTKLIRKVAGVAALGTCLAGLVGSGTARADVSFEVSPTTSLADGAQVTITMHGINAVPFAKIEIAECGNAYADNTPLPSPNPMTDCTRLESIDVSNTPDLIADPDVMETGIGIGNRSCIQRAEANFDCTVLVSNMVNQLSSPKPPPVPISFVSDATSTAPMGTTISAQLAGGAASVGTNAYVHVSVAADDMAYTPEGAVSVDVDGSQAGVGLLASDGTVSVDIGSFAVEGSRTLVAHFLGNGSFAASSTAPPPFDVISASNLSIGDVSMVEGNVGPRTMAFPVVLSQPNVNLVTVNYTLSSGTATIGTSAAPADTANRTSGTLKLPPGATQRYVLVKVVGDATPESNETFTVDLSNPNPAPGTELRRSQGTGTIIDDDTSPVSTNRSISIGDAVILQGQAGGTHLVRVPLTLSSAVPKGTKIFVQLTLTSVPPAVHNPRTKGGDWGGAIVRHPTCIPPTSNCGVGLPTYPNTRDAPDLQVRIHIDSAVDSAGHPVPIQRVLGTMTILVPQ